MNHEDITAWNNLKKDSSDFKMDIVASNNETIMFDENDFSIKTIWENGFQTICLLGKIEDNDAVMNKLQEVLASLNVGYYNVRSENLKLTNAGVKLWIDTVKKFLDRSFLNYFPSDLAILLKANKTYTHKQTNYAKKFLKDDPRLSVFFPNPKKQVYRASKVIAPNAKCNCGSGKKYKHCHQYSGE